MTMTLFENKLINILCSRKYTFYCFMYDVFFCETQCMIKLYIQCTITSCVVPSRLLEELGGGVELEMALSRHHDTINL
jgi:hypothetical protein